MAKLSIIVFLTFAREVKLLQKTLRQLQIESNKRDAKLFTNMFARMSKRSSMPIKVNGVPTMFYMWWMYNNSYWRKLFRINSITCIGDELHVRHCFVNDDWDESIWIFLWQKLKVEIAEPEKSEEAAATERECVAEPSTPSEDRMAVDQSWEIPFITCYPSNKRLKRSNVQKPALLPQPCSPVSFSRKERRKLV